jgi:hypothetical protein
MTPKASHKCGVPYCRLDARFKFDGMGVCNDHWVQHLCGGIDLRKLLEEKR